MFRIQFFLTLMFTLASAQAETSTQINYDGREINETSSLRLAVMKDVYEERTIAKTCYRRVQVGGHEECRTEHDHQCYNRWRDICRVDPRTNETRCEREVQRICYPVRNRVCEWVPDYDDVAYDCSYKENVKVGETLDYKVEANVAIKANAIDETLSPPARLVLTLAGSDLRLQLVDNSARVLLAGAPRLLRRDDQAALKKLDFDLTLTALSVDEMFAPLLEAPRIERDARNQVVTFETGAISQADWFELTFALVRKKRATERFDRVVFSAKLAPNQFTIERRGDRSLVHVDLRQLKVSEAIDAVSDSYDASVLVRLPIEKIEALRPLNIEVIRSRRTSQSVRSPIDLR